MITITNVSISTNWDTQVNPVLYDKSCMMDLVQIVYEFSNSLPQTGSDFFFNPGLFMNVGQPYGGATRPSKGFFQVIDSVPGTYPLIEVGILPENRNVELAEIDVVSATEFVLRFGFRMMADKSSFLSGLPQDTLDRILKNHLDNPNDLENIYPSVYNSIKELQGYFYFQDTSGVEDVLLHGQPITANWYNERPGHDFFNAGFCALELKTNFNFIFNPIAIDADNEYYAITLDTDNQNNNQYEPDLDFIQTLETNCGVAGGDFDRGGFDYDLKYYAIVVYNTGGDSWVMIQGELESTCLPLPCDPAVYGYIADNVGGTGGLEQPFTPILQQPAPPLILTVIFGPHNKIW